MLKKIIFILQFIIISASYLQGQELYFPPLIGDTWETTAPESLGWCEENIDSLYDFLELNNSKAFLVLKDGKIVLEKYFDNFEQDSTWYWASAAKSLTAFMVGLAQEKAYLNINESSQKYLNSGWTSCDSISESKISILHQLTMTSGLDDSGFEAFCTDPECLTCLTEPGSRWAYHNAPYTLLDEVLNAATGIKLNTFITTQLSLKTGISGAFFKVGFNNIFISKPRSMARFGLLILNNGNWNGKQIMTDTSYFNSMVSPSQDINKSYGYLWWLNGKESFMIPSSQFVFPGPIAPEAPADMISAIGKNGQIINVVPSENLVMVRIGNAPDVNGLVGLEFNRQMWDYFNKISCTSETDQNNSFTEPLLAPNPAEEVTWISFAGHDFSVEIFSAEGTKVLSMNKCQNECPVNLSLLEKGIYYVRIKDNEGRLYHKVLVKF